MPTDPADLRLSYARSELTEATALDDPIAQFERWFEEALASGTPEPNAMTLATAGADGRPSARTVLLKGFDGAGFVFFTNYDSRKGRDLAAQPYAALVFWWPPLERQVRIEGRAERVDEDTSETYFHRRPRGSQLGAAASPQSHIIAGRHVLEENLDRLEAELGEDGIVPRPESWGGYRVMPEHIEFWQGRPDRMHDRLLYTHEGGGWKRVRLAP